MSDSHKKPYLTIQEAAAELGCTEQDVYKLIEARKLPSLKLGERETVVPRCVLAEDQRRIGPELSGRIYGSLMRSMRPRPSSPEATIPPCARR